MTGEELRRSRIETVLAKKGVKSAKDIAIAGSPIYMNIYKQLFSEGVKTLSTDVIAYILEKFPDISADYIMRGEGPWERTKIVTPPTHRQDIHIEGGTAAISQSGSATVEPDEPIGHESLTDLIEEKDKIIASLQHDLAVLKEAIRVLASK